MINSYDEIFIDKNGKYTKWNKKVELPFLVDNPEYIAGQFTQALIEKEL